MTYLELCQELARECTGISGSGITAVTNQTGKYLDVVKWVKQAWIDIQNRNPVPGWRWMRSRWSVNTVVDDDTYAPTDCTDTIAAAAISRFKRWWPEDDCGYSNTKIYLQSAGLTNEAWLPYLPWGDFRGIYGIGSHTHARPAYFTIDPQNNIVLGPKPDDIYVISGEYQKSAQLLAADNDEPEMPVDFHALIWRYAMKMYAGNQVAPEAMNRAVTEGNAMMRNLEADQLARPMFGGALA